MDRFGDLLEGDPNDPNWVRPKRTAADYKRIVDNFVDQLPDFKPVLETYYDRFWEEEGTPVDVTDGSSSSSLGSEPDSK